MDVVDNVIKTPTRRGRPPKSAIQEKKKRGQVGRPVGDAGRIAEFKARLLSTTGSKVIDKVLKIAQTDGHPSQSACLKMCMDRLLPISMFGDQSGGNQKPQIIINIAGLTDNVTVSSSDVEEGVWEDG
ncbi:MAG: hypothetical protein JHC33_07040 [Ignisphaera sp.]|nr:hypothetical protein [Ignisphaera sp.]